MMERVQIPEIDCLALWNYGVRLGLKFKTKA